MPIQVAARLGASTCAFCRETIQEDGAACAGCGTQLHRDCWAEARRCPTLGCAETPERGLPRQVRCAACAQGMPEHDRQTCGACGVEVHPACGAMIVGCATEGCDGASFGPTVVAAPEPLEPPDDPSGLLRRARQAGQWYASLWKRSAWSTTDPLTRAKLFAQVALVHALPFLALVMTVYGSVKWSDGRGPGLGGALEGLFWSVPLSAAATAYAFVVGLVGIRTTKLHNGGLLTVGLVFLGAIAGMLLLDGSELGALAGGLLGALPGLRLFGLHVAQGAH